LSEHLGLGALLIAGPTASGKSALASRIAARLGGVVVNADSMQVYRDLRVLTARPSPDEERATPHRLYGFVDAARNYSVGLWLADAERALADARAFGLLPIFVGGTGLYFKGAIRGMSDMPAVDAQVRAAVRRRAEGAPAESLHAELAAADPRTAEGLRPSDRQRILRALEVFAATGRPLVDFQRERGAPLLAPGSWFSVFLAPERTELRAKIDARFDAMIAAGALEEARALLDRRLDPELPAMRAHGAPGLVAYLRGEISLEAAIERGKNDTRRYVKRQFTFARHQLPEFAHVAPAAAEEWIMRQLDFRRVGQSNPLPW
jgi:tRNA dimethylallyltransferase